jgi:hypothetical protein
MTYRVPSWGKVLAKTCDWWRRKRMTEAREHTMMSFFRRAFTVSLQMKVVLLSDQRCGSVTFWYGSGSGDPCLWLMDPNADPDPAIFVIVLQEANKNLFFKNSFSAYYFLKVHLHHSKIKSQKEVTKQKESGFFLLFLLGDRRIRIRIHTSD